MFNIRKETLERLRKEYPTGARVELVHMNDPYNTKLFPGARGTVISVDDIGSVHAQYYVEHSHPAIIAPEEWDRVQIELPSTTMTALFIHLRMAVR